MPVDRRLLYALGGLVAVVLLFLLVIQPLFLGPDDEDLSAPLPPPVTAPSPAPSVPGQDLPERDDTFETLLPRDPFQQLVVASTGGGGGGGTTTPGTTTPGGTGPGTGSGTGSGSGGSGGTGSPGDPDSGQPGSDAQVGATTVTLLDVFVDDDGVEKVIVDVNGTVYTAAEGERFAERFQVLDISGECATFLFGDSRFVLCAGEAIRK